jgi:hypothetical protein
VSPLIFKRNWQQFLDSVSLKIEFCINFKIDVFINKETPMKKHLLFSCIFLALCSCSSPGIFGRSSKGASGHGGMRAANAHACSEHAGSAYEDAVKAAMNVNQYTLISGNCRDLTDDEIENAGNAPGSGYHDSQDAAENSDKYAEVEHFEMDDGTSIIIDEEGVHVIS